jgi:hypothetical protein
MIDSEFVYKAILYMSEQTPEAYGTSTTGYGHVLYIE